MDMLLLAHPQEESSQSCPFSSFVCLGGQALWGHTASICTLWGLLYVRIRLFGLGPLFAVNSAFHGPGKPTLSLEVPLFPHPYFFYENPDLTPHFSPKQFLPTQAHGESESVLISSGVSEPETTSSLLPSGKSTGP